MHKPGLFIPPTKMQITSPNDSTQYPSANHRPIQRISQSRNPHKSQSKTIPTAPIAFGSAVGTSGQGQPTVTCQSRSGRLPTLGTHASNLSNSSSSERLPTVGMPQMKKGAPLNKSVEIIETNEHRYQSLQRKARASFKKLMTTQGRLERQVFAFFFISNTVSASQGHHFKRIGDLKQGMSEFRTSWLNFNQVLSTVPQYPGQHLKPTVLVVADELFTMNDK